MARKDAGLISRTVEFSSADGIRLIGGGGHALVIAETLWLSRDRVAGFFDDDENARVPGCLRLGRIEDALRAQSHAPHIFAIGDLSLRAELIQVFNCMLTTTVIHPTATIARFTNMHAGAFVGAGAVVNCRAEVDAHAIVNTRAVIEHDCKLASNVHVGPGAILGGGVQVGSNSLIGINASVRPNIVIGRHCTIGAGAAVVKDVADGEVVVGVPARPIRHSSKLRRKIA